MNSQPEETSNCGNRLSSAYGHSGAAYTSESLSGKDTKYGRGDMT